MDLFVLRAELVERLVAGQRREDVLELLLERLEGREREGLVVLLEQPFEAGALALALYINIHRWSRGPRAALASVAFVTARPGTARRRRAGAAPAPPLYQRLSSARRRLSGGSCPWGAGKTAWTHEQRRSGAKQARLVATPAFMGKTRPKSALHLKPPLSPAQDALPFLIGLLGGRSRTKP